MKKFNITNPFVFWGIVVFIVISIVLSFQLVIELNFLNQHVKTETFETHSYENGIEDLKTNEFPSLDVKLEPENTNLLNILLNKDTNILLIVLLIYSVGLSMLFTYRERARDLREKQNEKILIEKEKNQSKINIYENIEHELQKYQSILTPEFNFEDLDRKIEKDIKYILFASRVVLEKILLDICNKNDLQEETLNDMIYILFKKRILDPQTNGYAHTIKAFGNYAAHPNKNKLVEFSSKDALLVLSTLVTFLNILETKNLIQGNKSV